MNSKPLFYLVVPAAVIAVIGLLIAQVFWFQEAFRLKEEQFQDKIFVLNSYLGEALNKDIVLSTQLSTHLHLKKAGNYARIQQSEEAASAALHHLIDSIYSSNGIQTPFHFGIYKGKSCSGNEVLISNLPTSPYLQPDFETSEALSCFLPGSNFHSFFLGLSFPQKKAYLLKQTAGMLALTILLIWLLLAAFAYTLYVVHRQKKLSEIKNDFINNLTHEFKTPIASIALASSVLQRTKPKKYSLEEISYLQLISKESKRLENHIDKVLQVAVIDSGNFHLDVDEVNLHDLIKKVAGSSDLLLREKKGTLHLQLDARHPFIQADARHLFNMFYNLLDNAIKYSRQNPDIVISTTDEVEGICFRISDKGIGMDESVQQNIFEKFYRVSSGNAHKVKGFGLGLSYVKSIVDAHRGTIRFKSALDQGTEFTILLPSS